MNIGSFDFSLFYLSIALDHSATASPPPLPRYLCRVAQGQSGRRKQVKCEGTWFESRLGKIFQTKDPIKFCLRERKQNF